MRNVVIMVVAILLLGIYLSSGAQGKKGANKVKLSHNFTEGQKIKYTFQKDVFIQFSCPGGAIPPRRFSLSFLIVLTTKKINEDNSAEIEMVYDEMKVEINKATGRTKTWMWNSKKGKKYEIDPKEFEDIRKIQVDINDIVLAAYSSLWREPLKIQVSQTGEFTIESNLRQVIKSPIPTVRGIPKISISGVKPKLTLIREEVEELLSLIFIDFLNDEEKEQWDNESPLVNINAFDITRFTEERNFKVKTKGKRVKLKVESVIKRESEEKCGKGEGTFLVDKKNGRTVEVNWQGSIETKEDKWIRKNKITKKLKLLRK